MSYHKHKWGYSEILYADDHCTVARAVGLKGGRSSLHHHRHKQNAFLILHGFVEIWNESDKVLVKLDNNRRPVFVAPPGLPHRMVFATDAILYEFYAASLNKTIDPNDIVRKDVGRKPDERRSGCECHAFAGRLSLPDPQGVLATFSDPSPH